MSGSAVEKTGSVTAVCYIEGTSHADGALAFATALGQINFILSLSDDLSRSTNRVETFILKGQPKVIAMRGMIAEVQSDKENETRHVYCFLVMTATEHLYSIQCDASSSQQASTAKASQAPIEIIATYKRREDSELATAIGLYSCFNTTGAAMTKSPYLVALMEDKDQIVLCHPLTLEKVLVYQVPTFHFGANFREFQFLDETGQVMLVSKHLIGLLSFTRHQFGKMGLSIDVLP